MEQYQARKLHASRNACTQPDFLRRRHRRLARLAIACALMTAGGLVLLTSAIA